MSGLAFIVVLVIAIPHCYCLINVIKDFKNQLSNPHTSHDFFIEFTGIQKLQMLFCLISLVLLAIAMISPAYRYEAVVGSLDSNTTVAQEADNTGIVIFLFANIIISILYLRLTRMAYYFPLAIYIILEIVCVAAIHSNITHKDASVLGNEVHAGIYGGLGYYALILSLISAVLTIIVLLFKGRKQASNNNS